MNDYSRFVYIDASILGQAREKSGSRTGANNPPFTMKP